MPDDADDRDIDFWEDAGEHPTRAGIVVVMNRA
jgi:hypothetical protein